MLSGLTEHRVCTPYSVHSVVTLQSCTDYVQLCTGSWDPGAGKRTAWRVHSPSHRVAAMGIVVDGMLGMWLPLVGTWAGPGRRWQMADGTRDSGDKEGRMEIKMDRCRWTRIDS